MSSWFSHAAHPVQTEVEAFWYLNLTPEQQAAHDKLLQHLKETRTLHPGHDDRFTLLRFLKARQWVVHRAAAMYQSMVKWRIEQRTDHVYETFTFPEREDVLRHYPHFYHSTDKYGRPVYVELLGRTDPAKILEATTLERLMHYHICDWETLTRKVLPACSVLAGRPIITKSVILDLKGMSMKTFGSAAQKILRIVVTIDQDYYCESLGQMFIINTPTVFRFIWAVVNPLLEERTRRKIVILGSDYLPTITQLVPLERLPACLGGISQVPESLESVGPWTEVQLPAAANPGKDPNPHKAAAGDGQEGGAGQEDPEKEERQQAGTVKATAVACGLHQSATAPAKLHLGEEQPDGQAVAA